MKTILAISLAAMILGGLWFIAEVGVKESWTIVTNPDEVNAETNDTLGGNVSFSERVLVAGIWMSLLGPTGFSLIAVSRKNPKAINTLIAYGPLLVGSIAIVSMGDTIGDVLSSDFDWDSAATTDGFKAYVLFCVGASISAVMSFLNLNSRRG